MSFCSVDLTPAAVAEALLHKYPAGSSPLSAIDEKTSAPKKSYVFINFFYAFYSIIFTVVIPALPVLTLKICNDNSSRASLLYGSANFVRYFCEFVASPFMGSMADYSGRRPLLMMAFLICGVEFILLALFPSVPMLYVTRAMAGDFSYSYTYIYIHTYTHTHTCIRIPIYIHTRTQVSEIVPRQCATRSPPTSPSTTRTPSPTFSGYWRLCMGLVS
ncbi:MFS transporter [archaeon]|nr:MAG: MFS transporter [archaeon]